MDQPLLMRVLYRIQQLQVHRRDLVQVGQAAAQVAGECSPFDKGHHQVQDTLLVAKLDERQNMGMLQLCDCTRLPCKAPLHLVISSVVPKNHLDGHAPPKRSALPPLINRPHTSNTNTPDDIVVAKL